MSYTKGKGNMTLKLKENYVVPILVALGCKTKGVSLGF